MNLLTNIGIAAEAIQHNKVRTLLTSLGIIFGVSSVIAMLSVGKGAEQEILEQMRALGSNNLIIKSVVEQKVDKEAGEDETKKKKVWSPGLCIADIEAMRATIPTLKSVSPEIVVECLALHSDKKRSVKLVGIDSAHFSAGEYRVQNGTQLQAMHISHSSAVCVIGWGIKTKLFANEDAIGQSIKCGDLWLTIVGVLASNTFTEKTMEHLGIRDQNYDVYAPYTTVLRRFRNRSLLTKRMLNEASRSDNDEEKALTDEEKNPHQVDRIIVQLMDSQNNQAVAEVISRLLARRHNKVPDFEVVVPELLLRQEQRTKDIFNFVLGAIAGISLVVGGIGIMNIMLASVLERTKEIGTRRAIGATRRDIIIQFLSEAIGLSMGGGLIGVGLGVALSYAISQLAEIKTEVTWTSVLMSFSVSAAIGLIAGIVPARRAATMDPVAALRYE